MNLCLGTVQFGMDYGIRGQRRPSLVDALSMLDCALQHGIDTIDTANAYGDAEDVIGSWLKKRPDARGQIDLISKFRPNLLDDVPPECYYSVMKENLEQSLTRLNTDYLDGYMLHSARYVFNDHIIETLTQLKNEGYVRRIGVSVYEVEEARHGILRQNLDVLQLPFSIFDQRMLHGGVFSLAKEHSVIIHSRSAFIQGLILMSEHEVPDYLYKARPILREIDALCKKTGLCRVHLAMSYVKRQNTISHLVFGVDNIEQLKENISLSSEDIPEEIVDEASKQFANLEADIVMPSLWKK